MAKARKPAIELAGRSNPKSPFDDFAKWAAKKGLSKITKAARAAKGGKRGKYLKWKDNQLAEKQEKNARTYGDSRGPLDYWEGRLPQRPWDSKTRKEYNKRFSAAYRAEEEIGRRQGKATSKATKRYVTRRVPKKK